MRTLAELLSFLSGFAVMRYRGDPVNVIATSVAINLALAPLTAVVALRRGRSVAAWSVLAVLFGAWALIAALLFLTSADKQRGPTKPEFPTSDAA